MLSEDLSYLVADITLEMLRDIFYGFTFDMSLTLDDQLRQVVWFFAWTVPSTFVSWVQQIGVQVIIYHATDISFFLRLFTNIPKAKLI